MCASHLPAVETFFKGAHIKISARAEEDVDPAVVTEKVSKSTGSAYSFKQRAEVPQQKENESVVSDFFFLFFLFFSLCFSTANCTFVNRERLTSASIPCKK